jgi:hypothetical protein
MLAASSVGYKTTQEVKGAADAEATAIYARAYDKDTNFYQFWKAMETLIAAWTRRPGSSSPPTRSSLGT